MFKKSWRLSRKIDRYIILVLCALTLNSCKSCNTIDTPDPNNPDLPAYSETGSNTFGCLIDGNVFVPQAPNFSMYRILTASFEIVNNVPYLALGGGDFINHREIVIKMAGINLNRDTIIKFGTETPNSLSGYYYSDTHVTDVEYTTQDSLSGELNIKHLDFSKQIISGTFWFDAIQSSTHQIIKIREGRFDLQFTR